MNFGQANKQCLTCDKVGIPQRHNGQPAWSPDGQYIVFQSVDPQLEALSEEYLGQEIFLTDPGLGVNNNLWLMDKNGEKFWQLTQITDRKGVLHPHFSHDGQKLIWAELVDEAIQPSGDWVIKTADIIIETDSAYLDNITVLKPGNMRFFEVHGFSSDDSKILFSSTPDGYYQNLDIYEYNLINQELTQLTGPDNEWDEHAQYSPDGQKIVWMSSRGIIQQIEQYQVKTDYWLMDRDGRNKKRITFFNLPQSISYIELGATVGDNVWAFGGGGILGYLIVGDYQAEANILIEFE